MATNANAASINAAPSIDRKAQRLLRVREAISNLERRYKKDDNQAQVKLRELKAEEAQLRSVLKGAKEALNSMDL